MCWIGNDNQIDQWDGPNSFRNVCCPPFNGLQTQLAHFIPSIPYEQAAVATAAAVHKYPPVHHCV